MNKVIAYSVVTLIALFVVPALSIVAGMFGGWVVSLFFDDMLLPMFNGTFLEGYSLAKIGGFLGFVGSFVKSYNPSYNRH